MTPSPLPAKKGFTLIELLVTASILGMLCLAIFSTLASGLNVYQRVQSYSGPQTDLLLSLEKMERDLRNMVKLSGIDFTCDGKKISFAGPLRTVDGEGYGQVSLGRISYYLDPQTGGLVKEVEDYPQALTKDKTRESHLEVLAVLEDLQFSYFYLDAEKRYRWGSCLEVIGTLPKGIQVEVTFRDGVRNVKWVRTVLIPVA